MTDNEEYRIIPAYADDGSETGYYTREPDGVSGMTVSALSQLCQLAAGATSTLSDLLTKIEQANPEANDLSEPLQPFAGKELRLEANDPQGRKIVPDEACQAILEHYVFEARKYAGQAEARRAYRQINRAGMRIFIWSQTGYIPELLRESLRSNTTTYIERLENIRDHSVPDDLWTAFREGAEVLLLVEKEMGVPVDRMDLCDGSIGSHWSTYRKGKPWERSSGSYTHVFQDHRGDRECRAYDLGELSFFRKWLREVYIPTHLPKYLADKFGKRAALEIYQDIGGVTPVVERVTYMARSTKKQEQLYQEFQQLKQRLLKAPISEQQLELPES